MNPWFSLRMRRTLTPVFHQDRLKWLVLQSARRLCSRKYDANVQKNERRHRDVTTETRKKPPFFIDAQKPPRSVFAAGTAKRTAELMRRKAGGVLEDEGPDRRSKPKEAVKIQPPDQPLSVEGWRKLKESVKNPTRFDHQMMAGLIKAEADLDIAKSLLSFVASETGTLSYELLLKYLSLCVLGVHDDEMFDVYDIMRGSFPSLDTGASSLFIKAFCRTPRWREAVDILQDMKKVITPSTRNYGDIITAASLNNDLSTAWTLYDEIMDKGLSPNQQTWDSLFKASGRSFPNQQERLLSILHYMRDNQIYPQHMLASTIKTWFESLPGQKWRGRWTQATQNGVCQGCGKTLEPIQLPDKEYQQLKERVMTDIIQGPDVFKKTTPEELEGFKVFVKKKPAFDVIVDGLNVANMHKDKQKRSSTLLAVVSALHRQNLTILVLGRKHMQRPSHSWDRNDMNLIRQKAHCFFTENISEDDPFLLYATMHSGNHCRFVSKDLMRDHKACFQDSLTRRLFFKWQRGHQMVVDGCAAEGRKVLFQQVLSYDTIVQTTEDSWHIPYDDKEDRSTYEVPQKWLCLSNRDHS
ncbi:mitochondrial ribonuclease P catalytic subunit isoform X1 [Synchiropus splendidus]|uniref:mitochondrial ribonuclease P catalytic subunit isoform X1 n=1 Tax=Synchiropus splendidus TaxID=270530 RepID=UPI00237D6F55|nr:mitochondrial ribonuclease P catalytic subunit isoform X1 [Synchiropus splendidus]